MIFELELDKANERDSISPLAWSTQMDEDFVGHIATASRHVSIRTLHEKTLGRFKISLAQHWGMTSQAQQSSWKEMVSMEKPSKQQWGWMGMVLDS